MADYLETLPEYAEAYRLITRRMHHGRMVGRETPLADRIAHTGPAYTYSDVRDLEIMETARLQAERAMTTGKQHGRIRKPLTDRLAGKR